MGQNKAFNVSIVFSTETQAARADIEAFRRELGTVSTATAQAARVTDGNTAAIDREAASTAKATQAQESYTAAVKRAEGARRAAQAAPVAQSLPGTVPANSSRAPGPSAPEDGGLSPVQKEAIRARYNPIFAMSRQYETELKRIAEAERLEALTAHEATAAREAAAARMAPVTAGMTKLGTATKLTAWEVSGLGMQASDTIQSLLLGMPPLQVLLQQGPQAVDQIGGIGRALTLLKSGLTLPRIAVAAATAVVLLGAKSWNDYLKSTIEVTSAAAGLGRATAGTAGEMEAAAQTGAHAAGISVASARSMEAAFLRTGKIGHENFAQLIGISKDFAATMGISTSAAGDALAEMMRDPAKAADELGQQYGLIDAATMEHVKNLTAQNRLQEAQAALIDGMNGRLATARQSVTGLASAWDSVKVAASNAFDESGKVIDQAISGASSDDKIAAYERALQQLRSSPTFQAAQSGDKGFFAGRALASEQNILGLLDPLYRERERKRLEAEQDAARQRGIAASSIADGSGVNATVKRMQDMRNQIDVLRRGLDENTGISDEQRKRINADLEAKTRILEALQTRETRQAELDRIDIQIQTERNPLLRAELEARRTLLQMADQEVASGEISTAAQRARNQVMAQTIAGASSQASAMQVEAAIRGELTARIAAGTIAASEGDALMERELTMRPLLAAAAIAEADEKARLEEQIRALGNAYDALAKARREAAVNADARASRDRIADLRLETGLIGQSSAARIRAQAAADAERWIRDQGPGLSPTDAEDKRRRAAEEAEAEIQRDRMQRAEELRRAQEAATYQAAARLASTPIARAEIEAQQEYARVIAETGDAQEAAARADLIRSAAVIELRAALQDYVRTQDEQIARMRLEASLAGQSAAVRAQAQAAYEAELYIRQQGLDVGSAEAEQLREKARLSTDVRLQTERITEAWDTVGKAGENAIDGIVGALRKGDLSGAAQALSDQITEMLSELAISNPFKNALMGTSYATIGDVGGLGGIWDRLTGKAPAIDPARAASDAAAQAMRSLQTMQVSATNVTISGISSMSAANLPSAPVGGNVVSMLSSSAVGGARTAGAITGLNGEFGASLASMIGDADAMFGAGAVKISSAYRSPERQAELWAAALQKYGSAAEARRWVAPPGLSQHNRGMAADLQYGSTQVGDWVRQNASAYGLNFRLPNEPWHVEPATSGAASATTVAADLGKFAHSAEAATQNLNTLGGGFDAFGNALSSAVQGYANGGTSGGIGGLFGSLAGGIAHALKIPGFAHGGETGGSDPSKIAGVVHEREYVFDATSTARIGVSNLDALRRGTLRGYAGGGYVQSVNVSAAPIARDQGTSAMQIIQLQPTLINNTSVPMQLEVQDVTDSKGQRQQRWVLSDAVAEGMMAPGGKAQRSLRQAYGLSRAGIAR